MTTPFAFPLDFSFKLLSLAAQFKVTDAEGKPVAAVRQKLFKLKEAISVFADEAQTRLLYTIAADRILDFSARYRFTGADGQELGSVKQQGMKSLWRVRFDVLDNNDQVCFHIHEESVMVRFLDHLFSQIPVLGILSGYLFHPSYIASRPSGASVMRLRKQAALLEKKFALETLEPTTAAEQEQLVLSFMMTTLLERYKG